MKWWEDDIDMTDWDEDDIADYYGCPDVNSPDHFSLWIHGHFKEHSCFEKSAKVKPRGIRGVKHYTFKKCKMDGKLMALCFVCHDWYDNGKLDGVHPVGECPHCIYKDPKEEN